MSQTISGYVDTDRPPDPHRHAAAKPQPLAFPGTPVAGWQAILRFSTNSFPVATNIEVQIVLKNVSTNEMSLSEAWPLLANGFAVRVLDKDNTQIPLTSFGKAQTESGHASPNVSHRVRPGNEIVFPLELSRLYDLKSPGVYTVQVTRSHPAPGTAKLVVATGVARIAIEPPAGTAKN